MIESNSSFSNPVKQKGYTIMSHSPQEPNQPRDNDNAETHHEQALFKRYFKYCTWLLCLIAIIVLVLIGVGYTYIHIGRNQQKQIEHLSQQLQTLQKQQKQLSNQPDFNTQAIQALQNEYKQQQQTLDKLKQRTTQYSHRLQLSHIRYWVRAAILQIQTQHNQQGALAYLKAARTAAEKINSPRLNQLEQALANSITQLQSTPSVPTQRLYHQLIALQLQVNKLNFVPDQFTKHMDNQHSNVLKQQKHTSTQKHWWQRLYNSAWGGLSQALVIQHHKQRLMPLLPEAAQGVLKLNIDQQFSQAQWALLNQNTAAYKHSLQNIQKQLKAYFHPSPQRHTVIQQVKQLQQKTIHPKLPDISHLLAQVPQRLNEVQS